MVYLLFQNDALLGVFGTRRKARRVAEKVRNEHAEYSHSTGSDVVWKQSPSNKNKWHTPNGSVARLEIVPYPVL